MVVVETMPTQALDPETVLKLDGYLKPNIPAILHRHERFRKWKETIEAHEGGYDEFTKGYLKFGFNIGKDGEVVYREWAPNAKEAYLIGEFSKSSWNSSVDMIPNHHHVILDDWNRASHPMKKDDFGIWEITLPPKSNGVCAIPHDSKLKVRIVTPSAQEIQVMVNILDIHGATVQ